MMLLFFAVKMLIEVQMTETLRFAEIENTSIGPHRNPKLQPTFLSAP